MAVDNLSIDSNGDVFAACFPKVLKLVQGVKNGGEAIPSTIFRIKRKDGQNGVDEWQVDKVLEDIEGKVLPGATIAVHDVKTDSFWLGGFASPFITVCESSTRERSI